MDEELNQIFRKLLIETGLAECLVGDSRVFPTGANFKYYRVPKKKGFRQWYCAYSVHKNKNGKFCSWVYEWHGKQTKTIRFREHRKKKDAIKRALRLCQQRKEYQEMGSNDSQGGVNL